ncbi:MAG: ISL3 family transposase [Isosphaeraceae bacterium]
MRFQTILNRTEKIKGFTYGKAQLTEKHGRLQIIVKILPRKNNRPFCSGCGKRGNTYDSLKPRCFEHVPIYAIAVVLLYSMRRVDCKRCGVTVEMVPWGDGKNQLTNSYRWFLSIWAKRLSWKEVAAIFNTSWDSVCRAVEHAVEYGIKYRDLSLVRTLGIDEIAWAKGHQYMTMIYEIGTRRRLLAVVQDRKEESLREGLKQLGDHVCKQVEFVCSDMWKPYLKVINSELGQAVHILDRFHIMKLFGKALDEIRAGESRQMKKDGHEEVLKNSRWCLLKRPENLTEKQQLKLSDLMKYNLQSVKAYLVREDFQQLWGYKRAIWAGKFLDKWCGMVNRTNLEPMKKVAATIQKHRGLILNWFEAKGELSSGAVEGMNNKVKLVSRKSYGFRTARITQLALMHNLGDLPEPEHFHRFC